MIAVTGASDSVGGRVARTLAARGLPLRLLVRDAARAPELDAEVAVAEYRDGAAMRTALTLDEAAAILSEAAGREVVYERETLEQARESRRPSGAPDWEIEG